MLLHLVRHGRPAVEPGLPAATWRLHDDAAPAVQIMRDCEAVPAAAHCWSSPEPKALETAELLYPPGVHLDKCLREAERAARWLSADEFADAVRRSFETPDVPALPGWEPLESTRQRVVPAVLRILDLARAESNDLDVVLVGHGTAWTLLVSELTGAPPDLESWAAMTMPDHCSVNIGPGNAVVSSAWGQWRNVSQ